MRFVISKDAKRNLYHPHWKFCIGSGHAPLALRTDYVKQLKQVHEELGVQYVRFHGIFNDDMNVVNKLCDIRQGKGSERLEEWNFHKIGLAFDNVLDCGMKPFVELSFMPKHLASGDEQCMFFYRGNISMPKDDEKWAEFIRSFLRFLIHRYGIEEVRTWYFEVWNEPDLPIFFAGSKADYYHLYDITAKAVKSVDEELRVGGPATSGSRWVESFLKFCWDHESPVDFVSTHQYAGDPIGGINGTADLESEYPPFPRIMPDYTELLQGVKDGDLLGGMRKLMPDRSELENLPNNGLRTNARIVKTQAGDLPVFYTEWNENAIFSAESNDTRKVAAYDLKVALDTEGTIDASSVWCFSDIFEEFHHFPQEFHGGFGLLTSHGIPKPVYHMFRLLAGVGEYRVDLGTEATDGEIGVAAFEKGEKMQIFLFRQKMTNWVCESQSLTLEMEMVQTPQKVTVCKIDELHGNPYRIWQEMGCPQDLTREEVYQMKEQSEIEVEEIPWTYEDGKVVLESSLDVNDIWYIEVE